MKFPIRFLWRLTFLLPRNRLSDEEVPAQDDSSNACFFRDRRNGTSRDGHAAPTAPAAMRRSEKIVLIVLDILVWTFFYFGAAAFFSHWCSPCPCFSFLTWKNMRSRSSKK